jgi:gas vesicle protein
MDNSTGRALAGFVVGAAVGAALGVLFAPKAGNVTRTELKDKANTISKDVTTKVGEKIEEMKAYVQNLANDVRKENKTENNIGNV